MSKSQASQNSRHLAAASSMHSQNLAALNTRRHYFGIRNVGGMSWSLLQNNAAHGLIERRIAVLSTLCEGILSTLFTLLLISRMTSSSTYKEDLSSSSSKDTSLNISLDPLRNMVSVFDNDAAPYILIANALLLSLNLISLLSVLALLKLQQYQSEKDHIGGNKNESNSTSRKSWFQGFLCAWITLESRMLFIPCSYIVTLSFFIASGTSDKIPWLADTFNSNGRPAVQTLNVISLVLYLLTVIYGKRILTLNMPSPDIAPWSVSCSANFIYFEILTMASSPVLLACQIESTYYPYVIVSLLLFQACYLFSIFIFTTFFDERLAQIHVIFQAISVLILSVATTHFIFGDSSQGKQVFLLLLLFAFLVIGAKKYREERIQGLIELLKAQGVAGFKHSTDCETVLHRIVNLCEYLITLQNTHDLVKSDEFKELINIWEAHANRCVNQGKDNQARCRCLRIFKYFKLVREAYQQNVNEQICLEDKVVAKEFNFLMKEVEMGNRKLNGKPATSLYYKKAVTNYETMGTEHTEKIEQAPVEEVGPKLISFSVMELKRRLLLPILGIYMNEFRNKFPKCIRVYYLSCYIKAAIERKHFMCLSIMKGFDAKSLSRWDQFSKEVNDLYVLTRLNYIDGYVKSFDREINILTKLDNIVILPDRRNDTNIDIEHLIHLDALQENFLSGVELLQLQASNFWTIFCMKTIDPQSAVLSGSKLAEDLKIVHKQFKELEDVYIEKDPQLYFRFALVQRYIMNDEGSAQELFQEMKKIIDMRRFLTRGGTVIANKSGSALFDENCAFMILESSQATMVGEVKLVNEPFMKLYLTCAQEDVTVSPQKIQLNSLMPALIAEYHDRFINNFATTGESNMLNRVVSEFVVTSSGLVVPCHCLVKIHYSFIFGFCFVACVNPFDSLSPFLRTPGASSLPPIPAKVLSFVLFDIKTRRIYEFSEGFLNLLKKVREATQRTRYDSEIFSPQSVKDLLVNQLELCVDELLSDFDFYDYIEGRQDHVNVDHGTPNTFVYEQLHTLDLSFLANSSCVKKDDLPEIKVRASIRCETFGKGDVIDIGYLIMLPYNDKSNTKPDISSSLLKKKGHFLLDKHIDEQLQEPGEVEIPEDKDKKDNLSGGGGEFADENESVSSTKSQISIMRSLTTKRVIPRILKIVLQMVFTIYIVSILIASVNIVLNLQNKNQAVETLYMVRKSIDRINFTCTSRLLIRTLTNIANGYEPVSTPTIEDRWNHYSDQLEFIIDRLKSTQNYLDNNANYKSSDAIIRLKQGSFVQLYSINGQNQLSVTNASMQQAQNLYQSKMTTLNNRKMETLKGSLYLQSLEPNRSKDYKPTDFEQLIYFTIINGNGNVRAYNWLFTDQYLADTKVTSKEFEKLTLILTIVSIFTILIVMILMSPIVTKTEERKFLALTFFFRIPLNLRQQYADRCTNFNIQGNDEKPKEALGNMSEKTHDQQSYMEFSIHKKKRQTAESQFGNRNMEDGRAPSPQSPLQFQTTQKQLISAGRVEESSTESSSASSYTSQSSSMQLNPNNYGIIENQNISGHSHSNFGNQANKHRSQPFIKQSNDQLLHNKNTLGQFKSLEPDTNATPGQLSLKLEGTHNNADHSDDHSPNLMDSGRELKKGDDSDSDYEEEEHKHHNRFNSQYQANEESDRENIQIFSLQGHRNKYTTLFIMLFLMVIFAAYFTGSYFLAVNNYKTTADSVYDLYNILFKETCFENMFTFMRENYIRNESVLLSEDNKTIASVKLLTKCQDIEEQYLHMRRKVPTYLQGAEPVMKMLDDDNFCQLIYGDSSEANILAHCQQTLNGLLDSGMVKTLAYMYQQAQKLQWKFEESLTYPAGRSVAFLKKALADKLTLEILDTKLYLLSKPSEILKDASMQSVLDYFTSVINLMIGLFAVFLVVLTTALIGFLTITFKRIREAVFHTNLLLRIIPHHECLDKMTQRELKTFYVN